MRAIKYLFLLLIILTAGQVVPARAAVADVARLVSRSDVILRGTITKAQKLSPKEAPGLAPGHVRHLVRADVAALIMAPGIMDAQVTYLVDVVRDSRGKLPKLTKMPVLLFLDQVRGPRGGWRLADLDAQRMWNSAEENEARRLAAERQAEKLEGLHLTGFGSGFHVPGNVPGESETQIFLKTANAMPVSLIILRRPGQAPRYRMVTGDIINETDGEIRPASLLWYHVACTLPATLPSDMGEGQPEEHRAALVRDYASLRADIGACDAPAPALSPSASPASSPAAQP